MEISPVSAIRPVAPVKPAPSAPDLTRVFEAEYLGESDEDEYTSADGKSEREWEDEENGRPGEAAEETEAPETAPNPSGYGSVSLFA